MEFAKLHALGNDFVVMELTGEKSAELSLAALAERICHRRRGVGADGILYFRTTLGDPEAEFATLIFNADGSKAEMSGNGIRCLATFLYLTGRCGSPMVRIRTVSGIRKLMLQEENWPVCVFESSMGPLVTEPQRIPVRIHTCSGPILRYPVTLGNEQVEATITSMGNPHCSTFWPDLSSAPIDVLGPALERHPLFPNRTNVEFIQVLDRHRIRVRFWERGVGRTAASGTGSCAAAMAASLNGLVDSPVTVETEFGQMRVSWEEGGEVRLTGESELVFNGVYGGLEPLRHGSVREIAPLA